MKITVTGGVGFIGAKFMNLLVPRSPEHHFVNVDSLTYVANLGSVGAIEESSNCAMHREDSTNFDAVEAVFEERNIGIAWDAEDVGIEWPPKSLACPRETDPTFDYATYWQTDFLPRARAEYPIGLSKS